MATAVATFIYFTILLLSFLSTRRLVTKRGPKGALALAVCWLALIALFSYAPSLAPHVPLDQSLSYAIAQMVLVGSALGIPAGLLNRWRKRTNK